MAQIFNLLVSVRIASNGLDFNRAFADTADRQEYPRHPRHPRHPRL